jgi:putative hydroxymethylpyrimidine transport system substrate-binding protein
VTSSVAGSGVVSSPRLRALLADLVRGDGADPRAIDLIVTGRYEPTLDDVCSGALDVAYGGYWAWEGLFGAVPDDDRVLLPIDELGAPAYHAYVLAAREDAVEREPDLFGTLVSAACEGYRIATEDPELAVDVLADVAAIFPRRLLQESLRRLTPTWTADGMWGEQRRALLEPYASWLHCRGFLASAQAWRDATTNELLA